MSDTATLKLKQYKENPSRELLSDLVEEYIGIAKALARRFSGKGVEYDDLFQIASIALIKAIDRFEPDKGFKFSTYAVPTIVGDLRNYIRDKGNLIKASRSSKNLLYNISKVKEEFLQKNYREPSIYEIAEIMNVDKSAIIEAIMLQNSTNLVSLDSEFDEERDETISAFLGYDEPGFKNIENEGFMEWIKSHTSPQEYQTIIYRYIDGLSQRETSKLLSISQMQVSRIEKRIFNRLKEYRSEIT